MRFTTMILTSAAVLLLASTTPAHAAPYSDVSTVHAVTVAPVTLTIAAVQESQPPADVKIDISTSKGGGGTWYTQPIWLAVGGLALLVIILIAVLAGRSGRNNTTIVK